QGVERRRHDAGPSFRHLLRAGRTRLIFSRLRASHRWPHFFDATLPFGPGHCQRALPCGRWEAGREAEPLIIFIRGATSAPRRCSCLPTGSSALAASLGRGPDLRAHHPARIPFADRPGTVPSTLIRFMTRVPAREMAGIMREPERAWIEPPEILFSMPFETDQRADRNAERLQPGAAAEIGQVDDEAGGENIGADLPQQLYRRLGGAAGGDQIVDEDDLLAGLDPILVHLHLIQPVFEAVGDAHRLVRQLALLADGHEAGFFLKDTTTTENK